MQPLISPSKLFKYSITFEETTEDSRETSDYSNSGYIIYNESDIIGNILKKANQVYGIYYPIYFGGWESTYPEQDRDYFEKGVEKYYTLFVENEDGTDISTEEYDFITFLLSNGEYNSEDFQEYAVGGIVAGAVALGVAGLIGYYYFNKRKKGYLTGSAWTKEHYHDNEDEDYEVEPSKIKVPARNRKFVNGGGVGKDKLELFYVMDNNGNVINISKSYEKANDFLEKSLKFNGKIGYKNVLKSDWDSEKINTSNIKKYVKGGGVEYKYTPYAFVYREIDDPDFLPERLSPKEVKEFIENFNEDFDTNYKDWQEFNKGEEYRKFEAIMLRERKFNNGGTTTTRPTTTPEVVPDTDTKPRKPKTPYTPKHKPKPKAKKYDFILIKK